MSNDTNPERDYSTLAKDLKDYPQFVNWGRIQREDGSTGKAPKNPRTGEDAKVDDSRTFGTFDAAVSSYEAGKHHGVGFVLTETDPYTFFDFDNARDPDEAKRLHDLGLPGWLRGVKPWAEPILKQISPYAYIALSQSGEGFHVILNGKYTGTGHKKPVIRDGVEVGKIEVYDRKRFIALTGQTLSDGVLVPAQTVVDQLRDHFGFGTSGEGAGIGNGAYDGDVWSTGLSDDEAIAKARNAKNGAAFAALFDHGDLSAYDGDHSRADMALVGMLAFYLGPDPDRIDDAFRRSKLYRDKWDRDDYRERTIGAVLRDRGTDRAHYWSRDGKKTQGGSDTTSDSGESTEQKPRFQFLNLEDYRKRPVPEYLIDRVLQTGSLAMLYGGFGAYKSFLALDMALSIAVGIPWQGFTTKPGPTAFVIGEGGGHFLKRVDAKLKFEGLDSVPNFYMLPDAPQLNTDADLKAMVEAVEALPVMPVLIVVDTVARTLSGNENAQEDMGRYVKAAAELQKLGAAVLLVHHSGKNGEYRGSSALPGATETVIRVDRTGDGVRVKNEKQKDDEEFKTFTLKKHVVDLSDPPSDPDVIDMKAVTSLVFTRDDSATEASDVLTDTQVKVLTVLSKKEGVLGLTYTEWRKAFGGSKSTFTDARKVLMEAGYVAAENPLRIRDVRYKVTSDGREYLDSVTGKGATDAA